MRPMSPWTSATLVIIAVTAFGFAPTVGHTNLLSAPSSGPALPPLAPHPSAAVGIFSTDQYGSSTQYFYTEEEYNEVSFWAYDFAGDGNATVVIHDQNHTRDGVSDPAWTQRVDFHGGNYNYSYTWNIYYQIPLTVGPGTWNITINGTLGGFASQNFTVLTYYVSLGGTQNTVLSGHTTAEDYEVLQASDTAPYPGLTAVTALVTYLKGPNWTALPGFPMSLGTNPTGEFSYTVPQNTTGYVQIEVWANESTSSVKWSASTTDNQAIYVPATPSVTLSACPEACGGGTFPEGTTLYLTVTTRSTDGGGAVEQPGLHVQLSFQRGTANVSLPGVTTNFTSNATGGVALVFAADVPPFGLTSTNWVNVTVTDPLNPVALPQTVKVGFDLTNLAQTPRMQVLFDQTTYFGGEKATATWTITAENGSSTSGWQADLWWAYTDNPYDLFAFGSINSTGSSGTFSFTVPSGYSGTIEVELDAHNATRAASAYNTVWVGAASILLSPSESEYLPGDTVTVSVTTSGLSSTDVLYYTVLESTGYIAASGPLPGNQVQVHVPSTAAPSYYYVEVVAQDPNAGVVTKAYLEISLSGGLTVVAGIQTKSNYADGSFQPGETVTVTYSISVVGNAPTPRWFDVTICPTGVYFCGTGSSYVETSSTSGTISYRIPSNTPTGSQEFTVYVQAVACGGYSYCYNGATFAIPVNANPSTLEYELGAGSGLTVGWLILLIIIIVVALLLFLIGRRRGRSGSGGSGSSGPAKPWTDSSSSSSSPSGTSGGSSSPSTDPTTSTGSSGAPPLPTPSK